MPDRKAYLKAYNQKYYLAHKERLITRGIEWNRANKDKRKIINARHKAKYASTRHSTEYKMEQKNRNLKFQYRITLTDYSKLFSGQNGLCLGCKKHQSQFRLAFAVDHDHKTGVIRGLLCSQCNTALGLVKDNTETLHRLAEHVAKNSFAYIPIIH